MKTIATVTMNPSLDVSCSVSSVAANRKLRCSEPQRDPGGGGINVARAAHELGGEVLALWTRGGPTGQLLGELLTSAGISTRPIDVARETRRNLTAFDESSGEQYRFVMPGPQVDEAEVNRCLAAVEELDAAVGYVVLSGSLPPLVKSDVYARMAASAPQGCKVLVDTSGQALFQTLNQPIFLIKPNLNELAHLAGKAIENDADIEENARRLVDQEQVEVVVVSLGSAGAVLVTSAGTERIHSPTVRIRSRVGAGDSMVAGIVVGLARGWSLSEAVRYGVAAGAAAVTTEGTALCKREDTERLYRQNMHEQGTAPGTK